MNQFSGKGIIQVTLKNFKNARLAIVVISCLIACPLSLLALNDTPVSQQAVNENNAPTVPAVTPMGGNAAEILAMAQRTMDRMTSNPAYSPDPVTEALQTLINTFNAVPPDQQEVMLTKIDKWSQKLNENFFGPKLTTFAATNDEIPAFSLKSADLTSRKNDSKISPENIFLLNPFELNPRETKDPEYLLNPFKPEIKGMMDEWGKEMQKLFAADWEDQDRISKLLDQEWEAKINELVKGIEKNEGFVNMQASDVVVLDAVNFTEQISAINRLINPPARLHPWLKWLLYLSRVSPEMLQVYQAALEGRDRIYTLAAKSNGRFKIRYQGRIMDVPIFVWPEEAQGPYELVMVRGQNASSQNTSVPIGQNTTATPQ